MSLSPGTRLGPYEILSALGAGGMGEVYRAADTNLDRQVAIKILPDAFALDAERLARFEREARTLAALNHPHIAQIFLRARDRTESRPLPGTDGAENLFFSPDGKWLGFTAGGNLMKVAVDGGAPLTSCPALNVRGASWGDDDTIVFAAQYGVFGLSRVSAAGGEPQMVTSRGGTAREEGHRWPQLLPGGRSVLFAAWTRNIDDAEIVVQRLDMSERSVILRGGASPRYVPTGHVVYWRAGALMAVPFDLARLEVTGAPVLVAQRVLLTREGAAQFDVSRAGTLVYVPGDFVDNGRRLVWVDRNGREQMLDAPPRNYSHVRLSPDGQQVAVAIGGANDDIWVYDIPRQTLSRLTVHSRSISPVWTVDGARIIYRAVRDGGVLNLFSKAADGSGEETRLTESPLNQNPMGVSPDGRTAVFAENGDLWVLALEGTEKPRPFLTSAFNEGGGAFSPDGRWLAYMSDESGRNEIYVQPFPAGGRKVQLSRDGGAEVRWARNGELFYVRGNSLLAAALTTGPTLTAGAFRTVLEGPQYVVGGGGSYDVSQDGQRLLMIKEGEQAASATQINVVLNWPEELKRSAPAN